MSTETSWARFGRWHCSSPEIGLKLDVSRMGLTDEILEAMRPALARALGAMADLERGAIANPDENRRVGHYWLRAPELAPDAETARAIRDTLARVLEFAGAVRRGEVRPEKAERFERLLVIGIGGSALGPQLVADALGGPGDRLAPAFLDNTDPDGIDRVLAGIGPDLARTITVVISKSGGTPETRNGMLEAQAAYATQGLDFGRHAVAVTGEGSALDRFATEHGFLARFPMWDWIGGRTSETSAVGLLPAALQGIDVRALLDGAAAMDRWTRATEARENPAALLALAWHHAGGGRGTKDMVILPYKDRLALLSRYLQQLVMESLGKAKDLDGNPVAQGIAVYGNKGSTDQHAYVQQLRDGIPNFFVTFSRVLCDRAERGIEVEDGITAGDYLHGLLLGTRRALHENGRASLDDHDRRGDASQPRRADRALRARGRPLRQPDPRQRLRPTGRRGGEEGGGGRARAAEEGAPRTRRPTAGRHRRGDRRSRRCARRRRDGAPHPRAPCGEPWAGRGADRGAVARCDVPWRGEIGSEIWRRHAVHLQGPKKTGRPSR